MTHFSPKKGFKIILPIYGLVSLLLIPSILILISSKAPILVWISLFLFAYGFITFMSYLAQWTTSYWILEEQFHYKSLFLKGSVDIKSIRKIEMNASCWSSNKPATSNKKGMMIYYHKFEEVFVSPADNEELLQHLLTVNPGIEVVYSK